MNAAQSPHYLTLAARNRILKRMNDERTCEPQYQAHVELKDAMGLKPLGLRVNATWHEDPRRLVFVLARYKFVSKMLSGRKRVLEVGCGDAFATRIVQQEVGSLCGVDYDGVFVRDVNERIDPKWPMECRVHDMLSGPVEGGFDAAYALDVIEHIPAEQEDLFVRNIVASLEGLGVLILGCPSLESQTYASEGSKAGHVNCKTGQTMRELMSRFFQEVFIFSMNDEVVHTGFAPMAHYLFGMGVGRRNA